MVTMGTGRLNSQEEDSLGLAGEHDYTVLNMKEFGGRRLLLVKNPWRNGMTWKGSRSGTPKDEIRSNAWVDKLERTNEPNNLPGTFWIEFEEVVQNFESLYLNWNPGLFRYREDLHFTWNIPPIPSPACFTHNPQFSISSVSGGPVWVLLSRHFSTEERDILRKAPPVESTDRNPLGFISLYLFGACGRRIHLGDNPILRGPFVDSPQTLARFEIPPMTCYTLAVAQQGLPLPKYAFTLSTYSREKTIVDHALNPYPYSIAVSGAWTSRTAGGNVGAASYPSNPQFMISIPSPVDLILVLETAQLELAVHVKIVWAGGVRVSTVTARDILGESGDYRRGFAVANIVNVPAGTYTIICSTFEPGQEASFTLRVESTLPCEVRPIAGEAVGLLSFHPPLVLLQENINRMLAPLVVFRMTRIRIIARHIDAAVSFDGQPRVRTLLKIAVELGQGPNKAVLATSCNGNFCDAPSGVRITDVDISPHMENGGGLWLVVERLGGGAALSKIQVEVLSESSIQVGSWGIGDD
jgi:calpain-7